MCRVSNVSRHAANGSAGHSAGSAPWTAGLVMGGLVRLWGGLEHLLVHVAPAPVLPALEAANDRVTGLMEVLRGMLLRRTVAAADVAALQAEPEVKPPGSGLETLLAAIRRAGSDVAHVVEMGACWRHRSSLRVIPYYIPQ